ncbi:tape measure protein [Alistipes sp.]|uniref:tape measure protein n=1 Tax=Alistipes sp. TaxID=1872444 RepID=UPI0025BB7C7A|nr:tape measure protein [Alistipes sp.]
MNTDNGKLNFATGIDNSALQSDAAQARRILRDIGKEAEQEGNRIDAAFRRVGKTIVGVFTVQQAAQFARQIVSVRGEIESLEKSFEILAGKEYGRRLFNDIKEFAVKTPMQMNDLAKGAQMLLSFNIAAEEVMPTLRALGDISMGDAQRFNSLTLAFAQMSSTGKLMGQDLLQMINAGFNPLSVISEQTGKSIGTLKEEMAAGAISADMIKKAFMDATAEGGKFHGMLETQSKGIQGSISNLEGAVQDMFNKIGEQSQGIITGSIQAATELVQNYEEVGRVIAELIATVGVYKAALIALNAIKSVSASLTAGWTAAELVHYNALVLVEKAQKILNATILKNPYVLAAAAVAGLAYGLYKLITYQTDAEKAQAKLNETTNQFNKDVASEQVQIDSLFAKLKAAKEGSDAYQTAKQAIINQYGKYLDGLSAEIRSLKDVEGAYKAVKTAAVDAAKARAMEAATRDAADTYATKEAEARDDIYKALQKKYGDRKDDSGMLLTEKYYAQLMGALDGQTQINPEFLKQFDETHYYSYGGVYGTAMSGSYTTNPITEAFERIRRARGIYDTTMQEAERRFGTTPKTTGTEGGDDVGGKAEVVKNKKYWEDYKKEQQGLLDAMTAAELQTEEAAKIRRNIADAQAQIDAYSVSKTSKSAEQEQKQENQLAVQTAARSQKIQEYADTVAREARQAELDIRQAHIDGMAEGVDKELAQNNLNYDRLIEANRRRQEEMVEKLRDTKELEWQNANPNFKETGQTFDRSTVTAADLSQQQKDILAEYARIAEEIRQKANKESLDTMLGDVLTYEQARLRITEEYDRKRNGLYEKDTDGNIVTDSNGNKVLRKGVTQGNLDELERQEEQALNAVDEQFAQREATYQAWCEEVANLTLEQLRKVLAQAERELEQLEKSGTGDSQQIAVARAKVSTIRQKVEKEAAKDATAPGKRAIKEWEDLYKVLNECNKSFEEIGDTVGGVAGEIISAAGGIMTSTLSMINGIVQLVNMSATGMQVTSTAAAKAISTVEKASVILTVISAALQVATAIANLFNNDDDKQKEIEHLQERIDQLQWELNNQDVVRLQENEVKAMDLLHNTVRETRNEMLRLKLAANDVQGAFRTMFSSVGGNSELLAKSADKIAKAYANMGYTADKALGGAKYEEANDQLKNIAQQQLLIQDQINAEESKKKTDHGKIADWERQIEELGQQALAIINEMVEDIIGGTSTDIANDLAEAFFDAFEAGEDAAEAWGDKVNDIVADVIKRMLIQKALEEPLGKVFDKYKEKWFKDGQFAGLDAVIGSMEDFAADLNATRDNFEAVFNQLPDSLKELFQSEAEREASQEGIATASQESVDELNGRMTAVQGHTYSINENTKMIVAHSAAILESVLNIETHTESISRRMERVENSLSDVRSTVNDMAIKGIKVK